MFHDNDVGFHPWVNVAFDWNRSRFSLFQLHGFVAAGWNLEVLWIVHQELHVRVVTNFVGVGYLQGVAGLKHNDVWFETTLIVCQLIGLAGRSKVLQLRATTTGVNVEHDVL